MFPILTDRQEYLEKLIEAINESPMKALNNNIFHLNAELRLMREMNKDRIEGLLGIDNVDGAARELKTLIRQTDRRYLFYDPYR